MSRDESYKRWKTLFDNIAEKSSNKRIKVIIFNSIPSFPEVVNESKQWFNSLNNSKVKRIYLKNNSLPVESVLNSLADRYGNVEIFDMFSELCPESQTYCTSEKYKDQWHLSSEGALSLYDGLLKKLNICGIGL